MNVRTPKKAFMGVRLRRLREERGLTQLALAQALELSPSYVNQLEKNQRPLTVPILLKINAVFGVDVQLFSEDDEARLVTDLRDILSESAGEPASMAELRELAANMPGVARAFVSLHRRYREAVERSEVMATRLGEAGDAPSIAPTMPYEEVRDFFYARHNYIGELDDAAERIFAEERWTQGSLVPALTKHLRDRHGVSVVTENAEAAEAATLRSYDPGRRTLRLSPHLLPGQQAFQMATQLALLEMDGTLRALTESGSFGSDEARALARIGLANYFAGALILPYASFLKAAESLRYDIDRISRAFGVGFETVCHRLSTLQRPEARGVPFFFVRVDRAGNMSKRQSATDFHFSRVGGTCPLWNVYEAFASPGRILTQLAQMPDGRTYLWIARTVSRGQGGYGAPSKTFAIGLGCDLRHAGRLVYSAGLDLKNPQATTPIGMGCKVCERAACPQRAFPPMGKSLVVDERSSRFAPYSSA